MTEILNHFLQLLGWGMLCALPLIPERAIARSFFVITELSVLGLWIAALWIRAEGSWSAVERWPAIATGLLLTTLCIPTARLGRAHFIGLLCTAIAGAVATILRAHAMRDAAIHESTWFLSASFFVSAWLAGSTMVAMILGHYYLVSPTLSFGLLGRFAKLLGVLLVVRLLLMVVPLITGDVLARPEGAHPGIFFADHLAFLLQRGLALVFLAFLVPMIRDCVKRRANQSATGLLYVAAFLALMAEGVAAYFAVAYGLPI